MFRFTYFAIILKYEHPLRKQITHKVLVFLVITQVLIELKTSGNLKIKGGSCYLLRQQNILNSNIAV